LRQRAQLVEHLLRPFGQFGNVRILQSVLKGAAANPAADGDVLDRLHEEGGTLHLGKLRPQPIHDLRGRKGPLVARLEHDE
jgi:hypothetical protein